MVTLVVPLGRDESSKHLASLVWGRYTSLFESAAAAMLTDFLCSCAANSLPFVYRSVGETLDYADIVVCPVM